MICRNVPDPICGKPNSTAFYYFQIMEHFTQYISGFSCMTKKKKTVLVTLAVSGIKLSSYACQGNENQTAESMLIFLYLIYVSQKFYQPIDRSVIISIHFVIYSLLTFVVGCDICDWAHCFQQGAS